MALVLSVEKKEGKPSIHPSQVTAFVTVFQAVDETTIVQIETKGSPHRQMPKQSSQTMQFGRDAAQQLFSALKDAFRF